MYLFIFFWIILDGNLSQTPHQLSCSPSSAHRTRSRLSGAAVGAGRDGAGMLSSSRGCPAVVGPLASVLSGPRTCHICFSWSRRFLPPLPLPLASPSSFPAMGQSPEGPPHPLGLCILPFCVLGRRREHPFSVHKEECLSYEQRPEGICFCDGGGAARTCSFLVLPPVLSPRQRTLWSCSISALRLDAREGRKETGLVPFALPSDNRGAERLRRGTSMVELPKAVVLGFGGNREAWDAFFEGLAG